MQPDQNQPKQLFKQVLACSETLTDVYTDQLQTLLYSFPQCGVLHAIQARNAGSGHLTQAAAWFGTSELLKKVVKHPGALPAVAAANIIFKQRPKFIQQSSPVKKELVEPPVNQDVPMETEQPVIITEPLQSPVAKADPVQEPSLQPELPRVKVKEATFAPPIFKEEPFDETQKLIIENIAANDYFVFDKAFADRNQISQETITPEVITEPAKPAAFITLAAEEESKVTRYHDDKLPYSFLWWLDKTRSKHSQVYQPFAKPSVEENIETVQEKMVLDERSKEEEIVERFIQEEPQIRPPSGDKLDNENKAKQSVEDQEELITETLARIYADQMLYSKAIAAYKILMLKNPEKRRYFASRIEVLEKKIN